MKPSAEHISEQRALRAQRTIKENCERSEPRRAAGPVYSQAGSVGLALQRASTSKCERSELRLKAYERS